MRLTGNACTYSQEDAEELAREYVNKLGFEQMDIINTTNAMYRDCDLTLVDPYMGCDSGIDGYIVYFGRTYDNYSLTFSTANCSYNYSPFVNLDLKGNPPFYASQGLIGFENIRVYVDSSGICDMEIFNPMKEEGPMAGDIVLLPFEKVDSIAQDEIQKFADSTSGDWKVTEVELGYGMVEEDGKTALVPVWYYFCESNVNETVYVRTALLMINALDGTVIGYE